MTGGWQGQALRMRRWHARLTTATRPEDRYDFLYAFLENAFHLRDWLIDSGGVEPADLDDLFAAKEELRLCRDLANMHKHYSISRPSQPAPPSEVREYAPTTGNLGGDVSLVILSNGTKHDMFQLADKVLAAWEEFLLKLRREREGPEE